RALSRRTGRGTAAAGGVRRHRSEPGTGGRAHRGPHAAARRKHDRDHVAGGRAAAVVAAARACPRTRGSRDLRRRRSDARAGSRDGGLTGSFGYWGRCEAKFWPSARRLARFALATIREVCRKSEVIMSLRKRAGFTTAATGLPVLLLTSTASAAPGPGSPGVGDPYYPLDGNDGYDVSHYDVRVSYQPESDRLSGTTTILAKATQDLTTFNLDFLQIGRASCGESVEGAEGHARRLTKRERS